MRGRRLSLAAIALGVAACGVPIATGMEEQDANRVALALDRASVEATKELDPGGDGRFRVVVPRDEAARALAVLRDEELPRRRPPGVLDAVGKGALVPSRAAEHAQVVAGLAGDLERTLEGVDGVVAARVHLSVPLEDALAPPSAAARPTAAVLLEHRAGPPPIAEDAIRRLVAGGVGRLAREDVAVVLVARAPRAAAAEPGLARVGPIAVARGSARTLEIVLAGALLVVAALAASTLALYARLARATKAR